MIRFLIDEVLPRSTAKLLREAGFESFDVRDIGLRGAKDDVIYHRAQEENSCISLKPILKNDFAGSIECLRKG